MMASPSTRPAWPLGVCALVGVALLVAPWSRHGAGLAWVLWVLGGLALLRQGPLAQRSPLRVVLRPWLLGAGLAWGLGVGGMLWWHESWRVLEVETRLMLGALVTALWVQRLAPSAVLRQAAVAVLACMGGVSVGVAALAEGRQLPSNAIAWAGGMSFVAAVVWPWAWDRSLAPRWRLLAGAGGLAAALGVLLSQSRGAFGVLPWMLLVALAMPVVAWGWRRVVVVLVALGLLAGATLATAWLPQDPLRLARGLAQLSDLSHQAHDTELGSRALLWRMAWEGIQESPWVGHGHAELERRIQQEAQRVGSHHFGGLGHAHSEYLNAWFDYGLLGLGSVLALLAGLAGLGWRLARAGARVAAWQVAGLGLLHASASLTNANLFHQYYGALLGTLVWLVLLQVEARRT